MKSHILLLLFLLFVDGVFDAEADEEMRVTVKEGDDVTLHTNTVIQGDETVKWKFPIETKITIIAKFDKDTKRISVDGNNDGPFKDRLEMNRQTGSLTIKNMKSTDSGLYTLDIKNHKVLFQNFRVNVTALQSVSVMEGKSAIIKTGVTDIQRDCVIEWKFGDALIAKINRAAGASTYDDDHDERFRHRLHLDHQTGSLIITDISTSDSGLYDLQFSCGTHTLHRRVTVSVRASGLHSGYIIITLVGLLMAAVVVIGVMCCCYRKSRRKIKLINANFKELQEKYDEK